jgi:hypothetical protein
MQRHPNADNFHQRLIGVPPPWISMPGTTRLHAQNEEAVPMEYEFEKIPQRFYSNSHTDPSKMNYFHLLGSAGHQSGSVLYQQPRYAHELQQ